MNFLESGYESACCYAVGQLLKYVAALLSLASLVWEPRRLSNCSLAQYDEILGDKTEYVPCERQALITAS